MTAPGAHKALPPPNVRRKRTNGGCSLEILLTLPDIRSSPRSIWLLPTLRAPACSRNFFCAADSNIYFNFFRMRGFVGKHAGPRSWGEAINRRKLITIWSGGSVLWWRRCRKCLFWIILILSLKVRMAKLNPTARLVAPESRQSGASRLTS